MDLVGCAADAAGAGGDTMVAGAGAGGGVGRFEAVAAGVGTDGMETC
jgi:hypothetical protein